MSARSSSRSPIPRSVFQVSARDENEKLLEIPIRTRQPLLYRNPYPPPRTTAAAILLLLGGTIFLSLGLSVFFASLNVGSDKKDRGLALLILGGIMFIPGSYASTILLGAWRGWEGFDYSQVPSYDE